jgi:hypothetical protein
MFLLRLQLTLSVGEMWIWNQGFIINGVLSELKNLVTVYSSILLQLN